MKTCSKCHVEKPHSEFYSRPAYKDGLSCHCKECLKKRSLNWAKDNRDKVNVWNRESQNRNRKSIHLKRKYNRDHLTDYYIKSILKQSNTPITPDTIEIKRSRIKLERLIKKANNELKENI